MKMLFRGYVLGIGGDSIAAYFFGHELPITFGITLVVSVAVMFLWDALRSAKVAAKVTE